MTITTQRKNVLFLLAPVLFALAVSGCGGFRNWHFSVQVQNGMAVIDMDGVTLIFEGVPVVLPEGQSGGGASGSLTIAGSGISMVSVMAFGKTFINVYNDSINTMTFEGYSLKLLDAGTTLQIGEQNFDLTGEKKTVVIHTNGSAEVQEPH